jgi:hypothetical protein
MREANAVTLALTETHQRQTARRVKPMLHCATRLVEAAVSAQTDSGWTRLPATE